MIVKLQNLGRLIPKICSSAYVAIYVDQEMVLELELEYGSVITPMALAHPLHPIRSSRGISAETCRGG